MSTAEASLETNIKQSRASLDAWVREVVQWHFNPETGCTFWLNYAQTLSFDPRDAIQTYDDLRVFPFQDELRGVRTPAGTKVFRSPVYTFERAAAQCSKSRINSRNFLRYEAFSATLPDEDFPKGSTVIARPTGPSLALAANTWRNIARHLFHGGFDPRWSQAIKESTQAAEHTAARD